MVLNTAFFPSLMRNDRFSSLSGDPFDPSAGFLFPAPEGTSLSYLPHLLDAQAFIPPTERAEAAGFAFAGDNDAIRAEVVRRLNDAAGYRSLFARVFPEVRRGAPITYEMVARAIAEFEFSLTFANAPIDRYARGERQRSTTRRNEARCSSSASRLCQLPPGVGPVERDVQRLPRPRDRRPAARPVRGERPLRRARRERGLRAGAVHRQTPPTATRSAPRPCATSRCSRRSCTTAPSRASRPRSGITSTSSPRPSPTTRLRRASTPTSPARSRPSLRCFLGSTRSLRRRRGSHEDQLDSLVAFLRNGLLDPRASPERLRHLIPGKLPSDREPLVFQAP